MILKSDLLKKARLEEICNIQHERLSVMINKIRVRLSTGQITTDNLHVWFQEYEREMRSYEIPVKEFNIEDPPDYGDVFKPTEVPVLPKKNKSSEKESLKSFEQLDDLDDDVEMVTKEDPMLSSFGSSDVSNVKRTLSTESDSEASYHHKARKGQKTGTKDRKTKRRVTTPVQLLELHNSPRIPVVSRPVFSRSRSAKSSSPSPANIIFPLPKEVYQLPNVKINSPPSLRYCRSVGQQTYHHQTISDPFQFLLRGRAILSGGQTGQAGDLLLLVVCQQAAQCHQEGRDGQHPDSLRRGQEKDHPSREININDPPHPSGFANVGFFYLQTPTRCPQCPVDSKTCHTKK